MPKIRAVCLSNALPPDPARGAFADSAFSVVAEIARERDWRLRSFCGKFPDAEPTDFFFPILSRMTRGTDDAKLWSGYRTLSANAVSAAEKASTEAERAEIFLLLDPAGLSVQEWSLATVQARAAVPWVASDWPKNFPACDPYWTLARRHRHSLFPATLIASALIRSLYETAPDAGIFRHVRAAIFASENLRARNVSAFPELERSAVIAPPVNGEIFAFRETSTARSRVWGWNGSFSEKSGVLVALDAFARQAATRPDMRLILAGADPDSPSAEKLRGKIDGVRGLSERIVFAGKIPRERLAEDFYQRIGLFVFAPRDGSAFPLEAAEAASCGCLVFSEKTEETSAFLPSDLPLFFSVSAPETARLASDVIMRMPPEEWAMAAADGAARVQELCSPARVASALGEFLSATIPAQP